MATKTALGLGLQGVRQRHCRTAPACGARLRLGRGPAGEKDDFKRFGRTTLCIGAGGKGRCQLGEGVAAQRHTPGQQIARRHAAQIAHQAEHIAVANIQDLGIGHGQRKACAHQQITGGANIDLGMDARRRAVAFGLTQAGTQRRQTAGCGKGGKEQPVRAQHAPDQGQRARQIVDGVKNTCRDHQIERCIGKGQAVLIALNAADGARKAEPSVKSRVSAIRRHDQPTGASAEIEHIVETARYHAEPVVEALKHEAPQEIMRGVIRHSPVAAMAAKRTIEDFWRAHRRACGNASAARQGGMGLMSSLAAPLKLVVDAALPPRCPGCGAVTRADHHFCAACWGQLRLLAPPWCAACHVPFSIDRGADACCATCLDAPPIHAGVRAAVAYDAIPKAIALRLKYGRHLAYAKTIARHMARLMPDDADLLVPVPLHARRLWGRGFNQAGEIARGLSQLTGVPCDVESLRRVAATPVLRGLGAKARAQAVAHAFAMAPEARQHLAGKAVVLVDDVYTSGATTNACTRLLVQSGVCSVTILCWARVLDPAAAD